VFINSAEYRVLAGQLPTELLATVVVTDGPRPVRLFRDGRQIEAITPPATAAVEVTGAGDTLVGSFLAFRATGQDETSALQAAVAAASSHTVRQAMRLPGAE
jgi:sugar/nucleoside kinase (ribokinase family)